MGLNEDYLDNLLESMGDEMNPTTHHWKMKERFRKKKLKKTMTRK